MQVLRLVHACVNVEDMDEATRFFCELLGFEKVWELEVPTERFARLHNVASPRGQSVGVRCPGGGEIELFELSEPKGEPRSTRRFEDAGLSVLTLSVDDVQGVITKLGENGYTPFGELVSFPLPNREIQSVHFHGPSGVPLTFTQVIDKPATD